MGSRGGTLTRRCVEAGCRETAHYRYSSKREANELLAQDYYRNWKCVRHRQPEKLLSLDNTANSLVLISKKIMHTRHDGERVPLGLFWVPEGSDGSGNGYSHSPAHNAYADDFPEGTRLVITAYVETPEQAQLAAQLEAEADPR